MIILVELNQKQWARIARDGRISISYGPDKTIFNSIDELLNAEKVVTLNGYSMWKKESTKSSIAERIDRYHIMLKLPDGKFAVLSQEFYQKDLKFWGNKELNIDKDQIKYYDIKTHEIYENKDLRYPNPEIVRERNGDRIFGLLPKIDLKDLSGLV